MLVSVRYKLDFASCLQVQYNSKSTSETSGACVYTVTCSSRLALWLQVLHHQRVALQNSCLSSGPRRLSAIVVRNLRCSMCSLHIVHKIVAYSWGLFFVHVFNLIVYKTDFLWNLVLRDLTLQVVGRIYFRSIDVYYSLTCTSHESQLRLYNFLKGLLVKKIYTIGCMVRALRDLR